MFAIYGAGKKKKQRFPYTLLDMSGVDMAFDS